MQGAALDVVTRDDAGAGSVHSLHNMRAIVRLQEPSAAVFVKQQTHNSAEVCWSIGKRMSYFT